MVGFDVILSYFVMRKRIEAEFSVSVFPKNSVLKGTNGRQKTYEISHVYSIFYSGFMCQTAVIFGITKDGSLY